MLFVAVLCYDRVLCRVIAMLFVAVLCYDRVLCRVIAMLFVAVLCYDRVLCRVIAMLFVAVMLIGTFLDVVCVQMPMQARLSKETDSLPNSLIKDGDIITHLNANRVPVESENTPLLAQTKPAGPRMYFNQTEIIF